MPRGKTQVIRARYAPHIEPFETAWRNSGASPAQCTIASLGLQLLFRFHTLSATVIPWRSAPLKEQLSHLDNLCGGELFCELPDDLFTTSPLWSDFPALSTATELYQPILDCYERANALHLNRPGLVYTPEHLARFVAAQTISRFEFEFSATPKHILDPACGAGAFLIAAAEALVSRTASGLAAGQAIAAQIYGTDLDPRAISCARYLMALFVMRHNGGFLPSGYAALASKQLTCGDALFMHAPPRREIFPSPNLHGVEPEQPRTFDCILGNPPYGLSRDSRLDTSYLTALRTGFPETFSGKVNLYLPFLTLAHQRLANRGVSALVVPNSWLGINDARASREMAIRGRYLSSVALLPRSTFGNHGVETVVVEYLRGKELRSLTIKNCEQSENALHVASEGVVRYEDCRAQKDTVIPVRGDESHAKTMKMLAERTLPCGSPLSPYLPKIALQAYATGRGIPPQSAEIVASHPFHSRMPGVGKIRYLEGRDVKRYRIVWSGSYLAYGPWLAEFQPRERYMGPRVLVREVLGPAPRRIIACATEEEFVYNRSILHVLPRTSPSLARMKALALFLNSETASRVLSLIGKKSERGLFPKLLLADLLNLPIPHSVHTDDPSHAAASYDELERCEGERRTELETRLDAEFSHELGLQLPPIGADCDSGTARDSIAANGH